MAETFLVCPVGTW